jgi:glycosyltransferase involved in cell wall biosynthesis
MELKLSIIIPTYNSFTKKQGSLELCVASLFKQTLMGKNELIIVDDGSTDITRRYLNTLSDISDNLDIKVIFKEHEGNRAKARNIGAEKSCGKLLLFMDDDVLLLGNNCIVNVLKLWKNKTFMCGAKRYWTYPTWNDREILRWIYNSDYESIKKSSFVPRGLNRYNGCRDLLEFSFLSNFGVVSRKDFFDAGGFDEGYAGWGYEETDLMFRLLYKGLKFINLWPLIEILHLNHPLGKSEVVLTDENRRKYYSKIREKGVIFKVNHLFGVFEDDGKDIFQEITETDKNNQINQSFSSSIYQSKIKMHKHIPKRKGVLPKERDCPFISIIIPTYNSFESKKGSIELVLTSLQNQIVFKEYEVIVIDDGSDDNTINFLEDYSFRNLPFSFRYIKLKHSGNRSKCRNVGAKKARGRFLLFLDDDTVFLSDHELDKIISKCKSKKFLCGAKRFWSFVTWNRDQFLVALKEHDYSFLKNKCILPLGINRRKGFRDLFEYSFIANCGVVAKKDFLKTGGFDENTFDGWGREDVDLMLRLYLNNLKFVNLYKQVSVLHLNHPIKQEEAEKRELYFEKYEKQEKRYGYIFKVNHLFGIYENDGNDILIPITPQY